MVDIEKENSEISDLASEEIRKRTGKKSKAHVPSRNSMRNLPQYRNLSEDEFNEKFTTAVFGIEYDQVVEERIQRKYKEFEESYDLSEMMPNDKIVLRSMIQAMIRLEDYEVLLSRNNKNGITFDNITVEEKISKLCEGLRDSISKAQADLKITRKVRKSEKEESVLAYLEDLKVKAKKFYYKKHLIILCPKCHEMLFSGWWLYPDYLSNKIQVECHRSTPDGIMCNGVVEITSKTLLERGGCNQPEYLPESIR